MRHRSVASIVCAFGLTLALTACVGAQMSTESSSSGTDAGSIAPIPSLPQGQLSDADMPASGEGTPLRPEALRPPFQRLLESAQNVKGQMWARVIDLQSGEVLLSHNAETAHTPASTTKILTALTALTYLDETATLSTGTSLAGTNLYLWGEGDLLLTDQNPSKHDVNGRASLVTLAERTAHALKAQGINSVTLNWAPQPFEGAAHLPQWTSQEVQDFEGRVAAYAIDSGVAEATFVADPELSVASAFQAALEDTGISVALGQQVAQPSHAEQIAFVESATVGEQIRYMLLHSDNTMADQLCRMSARAAQRPTTYEASTTLVEETVAGLNIDIAGMSLEDCSGLSTNNKIPASVLTDALRAGALSERADLRDIVRSLPWAGAQGTMLRRHFDGPAIGNVQAKTGSLGAVSSLAGLVRTSGGRDLVFAVGIDDAEDGAYAMRPAIDAFVQEMATL